MSSDVQVQWGNDPLDELDLKAERVQFEAAAGLDETEPLPAAVASRLKAERVQERLQKMPGWTLALGGQALDRARQLPSPFGATDYANYVLREAARTQQMVQIGLNGSRVVVTVLAPSFGEVRGVIGRKQLDFAASLV